jgi:hypothetical protein
MSQLSGLLSHEGLFKRPSPRRFGVFSRANHPLTLRHYRLADRAGMWRFVPPSGQEGLLALLHGFDRRNYDDGTRRVFFRHIADAVRRYEGSHGHRRTLIVGDFNAHPFDSAVTDSDGLHAIGVRAVETRASRMVRGIKMRSDFFYNPMWRMYGRHHPDAGAATHYWLGEHARELVWHMVDQVVLRPEERPPAG